jgi:hypothetical protein
MSRNNFHLSSVKMQLAIFYAHDTVDSRRCNSFSLERSYLKELWMEENCEFIESKRRKRYWTLYAAI